MSLRTKCPHCQREAVLAAEALGKNVRCKGCGKPFTARPPVKAGSDPEMRAAVKAGAATATKVRPKTVAKVEAEEDDAPPHRQREESKTTLWIGLSAIGATTTLLSILVFVLIVNRHPQPQLVAHVPPVPPLVKQAPVVEPAPAPAPVAPVAPPRPVEARPKEAPPPKVDPVVEPVPKVAEGPANLYGKQGGEQVAPAMLAPNTLLRARSDDSFYRLDKARVTPHENNPRGSFLVRFRVEERGKLAATHLMLRLPGNKIEVTTFGNFFEKGDGTVRVNRDPNGQTQFPEDIECCLVRIDGSHGNPVGKFLVSDVIRIGDPGEPATRPRDWTQAEIARFTKDAPSGLKENANPGVGVDTAFAGTADGSLIGRRFVDPNRPLLGLEYRPGSWAGEQCLGALRPIYNRDQNALFPQTETAKDGYAVSGAEVQVRNNIDAIKLHYRRLKPDGSLDPNDVYEGQWIGAQSPAARIVTLGDTGPRVLGIHLRTGAVVDGFALVLER